MHFTVISLVVCACLYEIHCAENSSQPVSSSNATNINSTTQVPNTPIIDTSDFLQVNVSSMFTTVTDYATNNNVTPMFADSAGATRTFNVLSWFPKPKDPTAATNLTILPILAILVFLIGICLKGCTWCRESMKERDRNDAGDHSFFIIQEGDKEYLDIDFRSDISTPYDTYSSYMSFLKRNNNYDTVTSQRSFRPYDTVTSYRSFLLQRLDNPNSESIRSYRQFMQQVSKMKDVEIQVDVLDDKSQKGEKSNGRGNSKRVQPPNRGNSFKQRSHSIEEAAAALISDPHPNGNCAKLSSSSSVTKHESLKHGPSHRYEKSPVRHHHDKGPVELRCEKNLSRQDSVSVEIIPEVVVHHREHRSMCPRFKVSFVKDDLQNTDDEVTKTTKQETESHLQDEKSTPEPDKDSGGKDGFTRDDPGKLEDQADVKVQRSPQDDL